MTTHALIAALGAVVLVCMQAGVSGAQTLAGSVSSAEEGAMEGVLVSARKSGSPITVTVVTDQHGEFPFSGRAAVCRTLRVAHPRGGLRSRRAGRSQRRCRPDATLRSGCGVPADLAAQLTNTEWFMSMPGTPEQKRPLIECMSCHSFERIARSTYDAEQFFPVLQRMAQYANNTTQARIQARVVERPVHDDLIRKLAAYLATVNLSAAKTSGDKQNWPYELQTLPRPKGRATHVVITEYAMPRPTIAPHDVRTDARGHVWYSNFVESFLGELDPKTGENRDYAIPERKPGSPTGSLDLEADADGNLWLALMFQAGVAKFDVKTKTFAIFPVQPELDSGAEQQSMVMPRALSVDGKVWSNDVAKQQIMRLDLKTGQYELFDPFKLLPKGKVHAPYGMVADEQNNLYFMDFGDENIGRIDAKSGEATLYPTPTPKSRPRRTMMDNQGRLWFTEFAANKLGMFDTKTESFKEWNVPTPHTYPYDVFMDKNGELWSGGMASDRVLRFAPQSGSSVEYLLPQPTNIRRVFVDNSTDPVTFWAGNNHGAEIVSVQPLD